MAFLKSTSDRVTPLLQARPCYPLAAQSLSQCLRPFSDAALLPPQPRPTLCRMLPPHFSSRSPLLPLLPLAAQLPLISWLYFTFPSSGRWIWAPGRNLSFCSLPSPPSSEFIRSPVCFSVSPPQGKLSLIHGHSQGPSTGLTWNQQPRATCQIGFHKSRVSNLRFPHCLCLARSFSPTPLHFPAGPPYQATLDMA